MGFGDFGFQFPNARFGVFEGFQPHPDLLAVAQDFGDVFAVLALEGFERVEPVFDVFQPFWVELHAIAVGADVAGGIVGDIQGVLQGFQQRLKAFVDFCGVFDFGDSGCQAVEGTTDHATTRIQTH